jgi:hypothetical protein
MRNAIIALLVGIIAGYWIGYKDAYRGEKAIGSRIRIAMGKMSPEERQAIRHQRQAMLRDSIRAKSGLAGVDSILSTNIP